MSMVFHVVGRPGTGKSTLILGLARHYEVLGQQCAGHDPDVFHSRKQALQEAPGADVYFIEHSTMSTVDALPGERVIRIDVVPTAAPQEVAHGYASQSILAGWVESDAWARNRCGGSVIPVCEAEALETDRAIASFKDTRRALARALVLVYVQDFGVIEAAFREHVAVSSMHARLSQADAAIAMWLEDRAKEAQRLRESARGSFRT